MRTPVKESFFKRHIFVQLMKAGVIAFVFLLGCFHSKINVEIHSPADGATISGSSFDLSAEIRSSGQCMGGERCEHVDWILLIDGTQACSGQGSGGSGSYNWCQNTSPSYCEYAWSNIATGDLGSGTHTLELKASAPCHDDNSDSIQISF